MTWIRIRFGAQRSHVKVLCVIPNKSDEKLDMSIRETSGEIPRVFLFGISSGGIKLQYKMLTTNYNLHYDSWITFRWPVILCKSFGHVIVPMILREN